MSGDTPGVVRLHVDGCEYSFDVFPEDVALFSSSIYILYGSLSSSASFSGDVSDIMVIHHLLLLCLAYHVYRLTVEHFNQDLCLYIYLSDELLSADLFRPVYIMVESSIPSQYCDISGHV